MRESVDYVLTIVNIHQQSEFREQFVILTVPRTQRSA
jgi:hypothetical protein